MEDPSSVTLMPSVEDEDDLKAKKKTKKRTKKDKKKKKKKKEKKKHKKDTKKRKHHAHDDDTAVVDHQQSTKKSKRRRQEEEETPSSSLVKDPPSLPPPPSLRPSLGRPAVESSAVDPNATATVDVESALAASVVATPPAYVNNNKKDNNKKDHDHDHHNNNNNVTLLLFYQYVEPPWSNDVYKDALKQVEQLGKQAGVTGRMRVAREGLNCTLTGTRDGILTYCRSLRQWKPECFLPTEFKLTHDLPQAQRFRELKIIPVTELVHYGLDGAKAPAIAQHQGTHLEPRDYHAKLAADNTVVIDVRNHYEAAIGRFDPPSTGAEFLDPLMRKSTEFPVWLDSPETKQRLRNKQVLMYCTGGIRCERASALLKYKMTNDPEVKDLNIQGVYQLQGGIDKYFKEFPEGGYWKGKNYVFDKRFAHAPPASSAGAGGENDETTTTATENGGEEDDRKPAAAVDQSEQSSYAAKKAAKNVAMGQCEACQKPWDRYRGKRRCPTCGVPSLICRDCWQAHESKTRPLDKSVRCDLCVEQGIHSKHELRQRDQQELEAYEQRMAKKGLLHAAAEAASSSISQPNDNSSTPEAAAAAAALAVSSSSHNNPNGVTRLFLKNMCRKNMTEEVLVDFIPGITHIVWRIDHRNNDFFYGQAWVEMESPAAAAQAVARSGEKVLGRPLYVSYQAPDGKDAWPPPRSAVARDY